MKTFIKFLYFSFIFCQQQIDFPMKINGVKYDSSIPLPQEIIGHKIGTQHTRTSQVIDYFEALAQKSDKVLLVDHAKTHEGRRLVHAIVTHPDNHKNLEQLRRNNLLLSDSPNTVNSKKLEEMPLVAYLGFSIHGNEASGTEASMLLLYHLAAGNGKEIEDVLKNTILLIDPMLNPDGRDRFVNWVNGNRGAVSSSDGQDREHNQPWPSGRTNHYLFDMNRDWMPATQPESNGRIKLFHSWRPQFLLDAHEMGPNSTFFFQPGIASRTNPNTPKKGVALAYKLAPYHAKRLDSIQSMYYSEQSFDDFYYGKGSTFGDIHGSVGILFEQASSRSLEVSTEQGKLTYAFTIRNHFVSTLGTLDGLVALKKDFLNYQKEFYSTASSVAKKNKVKGYLISLKENRTKAQMLLQNLQKHRIDIYSLKKPVAFKSKKFKINDAVIIPMDQPQARFIKAIMEKVTNFEDSLFYDVSAWSLPLAYGVDYYEMKQNLESYLGGKLKPVKLNGGIVIGGRAQSAYLMKWNRYYNPKSLYSILDSGIFPRLTTASFEASIDGKNFVFDRGTIVIPVSQRDADASLSPNQIYDLMKRLASEDHAEIYATNSASTPVGPDLGGAFQSILSKPRVAILSGPGTSAYGVGEIWHLLNYRMKVPVSLLDAKNLNTSKLAKYNTIIAPDGEYFDLDTTDIASIKEWIKLGGTFISMQSGSKWAVSRNIIDEKIIEHNKAKYDIPYDQVRNVSGAQRIGGAIFNVEIDNTHPIGYGYKKNVPLFRRGETFFELSKANSANIGRYSQSPLISGYISKEKLDQIKSSASIIGKRQGEGRVVLFADNLAFRAFWYGSNGLFLNAVFFGRSF